MFLVNIVKLMLEVLVLVAAPAAPEIRTGVKVFFGNKCRGRNALELIYCLLEVTMGSISRD